jgi:hypothetical protein
VSREGEVVFFRAMESVESYEMTKNHVEDYVFCIAIAVELV